MSEPTQGNRFRDKSPAELDRLQAELDEAKNAVYAKKDLVALKAFKWSMKWLSSRGKLPTMLSDIPQQAYPRESVLARPGNISETEISNIEKTVNASLEKAGS